MFDLSVLSRDFQNELIIHLGEKTCTSLIASHLLFPEVTKLSLLANSSIFLGIIIRFGTCKFRRLNRALLVSELS